MSYWLAILMALTVGAGSVVTMQGTRTTSSAPAPAAQGQGKVPYDCKAPCSIGDPDCTCGTGGK